MVLSVWRADFVMGPIRSKLSVGNTRRQRTDYSTEGAVYIAEEKELTSSGGYGLSVAETSSLANR